MSPEELKDARKKLQCTAKELAAALDVEPALLATWERGDAFPTKKNVDRIQALLAKGKAAFPRKSKADDPFEALRDPDTWMIVRKVLAHPKLRAEVARLAEKYEEP
jgi:transcriptional regulator with XRE-family HTH domain